MCKGTEVGLPGRFEEGQEDQGLEQGGGGEEW